jgi:hypothetical protein
MVDKVAPGQVFSEYFGFPCQSSFYHYLHSHHHLSSGAGKIGQQWPQYPKSHGTNKKKSLGLWEIRNKNNLPLKYTWNKKIKVQVYRYKFYGIP